LRPHLLEPLKESLYAYTFHNGVDLDTGFGMEMLRDAFACQGNPSSADVIEPSDGRADDVERSRLTMRHGEVFPSMNPNM